MSKFFFPLTLLVAFATSAFSFAADNFPKFIVLPEYVATPDGMEICPKNGDLVVACPNFGDTTKPACIIRINKKGEVSKWVDVPVLKETGIACPMGIEFAPDGSLFVCDNQNWATGNGDDGELNQGRLLRLYIKGNKVVKTVVVASGISHPNGVKIRDGYAYMTVSCLPKVKNDDGLLTSAVYRFPLDAHDIAITNTLEDENIYFTFKTENRDCQYGADGIIFDEKGNLYIGNFGDGTLLKATPKADGGVELSKFAVCDPIPPLKGADGEIDPTYLEKATKIAMRTTDGVCRDDKTGEFYVADFSNNGVAKVSADGKKIEFVATSPDSDGLNGELNQPGEPRLWNGMLAVTCFDMVCDGDKVNTKHDPRATIVFLRVK